MAFADAVKKFPELCTPRLRLRQIRVDDAEAYYKQVIRLPKLSGWSYEYATRSVEHAKMMLRSKTNEYARGKTIIPWAIETGRSKKLIGTIQLYEIENRSKAQLAYWLSNRQAGRGLMTEAAKCVIDFAFGPLDLHRLWATTHVDNTPSQNVLTKVGFVREGLLRQHRQLAGVWCDSIYFGLLRDDKRPTDRS